MVGPVGFFFKTICKANKLQKEFRDGGDDGKISGVGNEPGRGEATGGKKEK